MIFAYNKEQVGDVLLVILEDTKDIKRSVERKGKVARVTADETGKTLAWNIFEASSLIDIEGNGGREASGISTIRFHVKHTRSTVKFLFDRSGNSLRNRQCAGTGV